MGAQQIRIVFHAFFFLRTILLATAGVPSVVFLFAVKSLLLGFAWLARWGGFRFQPAAAPLALGSYFAASGFSFLAAVLHHSLEGVVTASFPAARFVVVARRTSRFREMESR